MARHKLQSAMEYLMTYGWAILIIAVVLGALFGLGFFNSANLAPKVAAGSCQVYRPQGPTSTSFINLEGTCNNELPQYVAYFNGQNSWVGDTSVAGLPAGSTATESAWIYPSANQIGCGAGKICTIIFSGTPATFNAIQLYFASSTFKPALEIWAAGTSSSGLVITKNAWNFVALTVKGTTVTFYVNGQSEVDTVSPAPNAQNLDFYLGRDPILTDGLYNGSIADVQIYNSSLTSNEVTALYDEGIGGVPININNLVGWWPLNGNANDYSGNLNNGASTNVVFTNSWTSGYTAP